MGYEAPEEIVVLDDMPLNAIARCAIPMDCELHEKAWMLPGESRPCSDVLLCCSGSRRDVLGLKRRFEPDLEKGSHITAPWLAATSPST
jgi:hypothetical protein